jgi:hypothetical protein
MRDNILITGCIVKKLTPKKSRQREEINPSQLPG